MGTAIWKSINTNTEINREQHLSANGNSLRPLVWSSNRAQCKKINRQLIAIISAWNGKNRKIRTRQIVDDCEWNSNRLITIPLNKWHTEKTHFSLSVRFFEREYVLLRKVSGGARVCVRARHWIHWLGLRFSTATTQRLHVNKKHGA